MILFIGYWMFIILRAHFEFDVLGWFSWLYLTVYWYKSSTFGVLISLCMIFSPFQLSVSERYSSVNIYGGWAATNTKMTSLRHIPVRESDNYYTLSDVVTNGQGLHGEHINLLALVKSVGARSKICL